MVKAGMNSFARTLANEEGDHGVGVWAIRPGMVDVGWRVALYGFSANDTLEFRMLTIFLRSDQHRLIGV
jgi:NAD(P)-dependent dehydrogenase (short-subunit alcohol dehydrogenase family)